MATLAVSWPLRRPQLPGSGNCIPLVSAAGTLPLRCRSFAAAPLAAAGCLVDATQAAVARLQALLPTGR
eukprot:3847177-Alexandrium_andersonii.AAC.1